MIQNAKFCFTIHILGVVKALQIIYLSIAYNSVSHPVTWHQFESYCGSEAQEMSL